MKNLINDFKNNLTKVTIIIAFSIALVAAVGIADKAFAISGGGGDGCGSCGGGGGSTSGGGGGEPIVVPVVYSCTNGATNYPSCNVCPAGKSIVNGVCTTIVYACTNGATNYPNCNSCPAGKELVNNVCTTIVYSCTNGATNYPSCNVCPAGKTLVNNVCTAIVLHPTANITANPSSITLGNNTNLTWSSTNATYCVLNGGQYNNQTVGVSGSVVATPNVGTNYTINCFNGSGQSANDAAYVTVNQVQNVCTNGYTNYPVCGPVYNAPTATIYPSSYSINSGSNVTLYWSSTNATYCTAQPFPFSGSKNISGSESVNLNQTTTFTITCFNQNGQSASAQTTVTVNTVNNDVYCNGVRYPAGTVCPNVNNGIAVSTTGANPSQTTANIFGYINPGNGNAQMYFEYGTNYNLNNRTNTQYAYNAGQFSANITGLTCGTTYYYRAVGQNNFETKYGSTQSFVTSACTNNNYTDNTVLTRSATSVYQNGAQLNGAFIYGNTNNSCTAYFEYGTNYNLGNRSNAQNLFNNSGVNYFSQAISGLTSGTRYYYRAVSNCNGQLKYGSILSFVTVGHTIKKHVYVKPITKVVTAPTLCNCDTTNVDSNNVAIANTQYMDLIVERMESGAMIGGNASYRVVYKNTSSTTLQDVVIRVIFPEELTILTADRGDFSVGGNSLTYTISQLSKLEEGRINITTKVKSNLESGKQIVVNGYANYSVPTIVKNGQLFKDEVTAYVLSVLTDSNTSNNNGNNNSNKTNDIFGGNFFQWIVLLGLILLFIITIVYLFTASKRTNA